MTSILQVLLLTIFVKADAGISLEHIKTEYRFTTKDSLPSCKMSHYRRLEREKTLREISYNLKKLNFNAETFLKDRYITNKYFFETLLWTDEIVIVANTWSLTMGLAKELEADPENVFLKIQGDGILWQEKMSRFPDEVDFYWDFHKKILTTLHTTYYADYCEPRQKFELEWFPKENKKPFSSQYQLDQLILKLKEFQ